MKIEDFPIDDLRKIVLGFAQLTNNEGVDGWRVTLRYDNEQDGAQVIDADGNVIAECYDDIDGCDEETLPNMQCVGAMLRAVKGIKPEHPQKLATLFGLRETLDTERGCFADVVMAVTKASAGLQCVVSVEDLDKRHSEQRDAERRAGL